MHRLLPSSTRGRRRALLKAGALVAFGATSVAVALAESPPLSVDNAATLYLIPVAVAGLLGPRPAVATAIAAFIAYDLLFVEPPLTLTVEEPREWLDLLLFLVVGLTIGRLAGSQAARAEEAERRYREATALFALSRTLATSPTTDAALPAILALLLEEGRLAGIRVTRGPDAHVVAEAGATPESAGAIVSSLARRPGAEPASWVRTHQAARGRRDAAGSDLYRIAIETDGEVLGALWVTRARAAGAPGRAVTRLLSLAADQVALAWQRERLAAEAKQADVELRSEAAQSALLELVSHDLRTPLASIRASAGGLADPAVDLSDADRRAAAQRIDAEAERLNQLVGNLLDLSRIQGGSLVPHLEPHDLADLVDAALRRLSSELPRELVRVQVAGTLPPVLVDPVLLDQALANILDNIAQHAPGAAVTIAAQPVDGGAAVDLRIEDEGPGVPELALGRLFERFYRAPRADRHARRGLGIGLAVVRGAVEAMGGTVRVERGAGGGLAVVLRLCAERMPDA
jgi:two-component system sensor histidine kinase KdpD